MSAFPSITPDASDWDWMEIVVFGRAIESEGFDYAAEHYGPLFRSPELRPLENDHQALRAFVDAHGSACDAWWAEVGYEAAGDFYNDHIDAHHEEKTRRAVEAEQTSGGAA